MRRTISTTADHQYQHQNVQPSPTQSVTTFSHHHQQAPRNNSFASSTRSYDPRHQNFHPLRRHQNSADPIQLQSSASSPSAAVNNKDWPPLQVPSISPFITPVSSRPTTPRRNTAARLVNPRNYSPRSPKITVKRIGPPLPDPPARNEQKRQPILRAISEKRQSKHSLSSWPSLRSPSSSLQAELGSVEDRRISDSVAVPAKILTKQKPRAYSLGAFESVVEKEEGTKMPDTGARQDAALPAGIVDVESGTRGNRLRSNSKASLPIRQNENNDEEQHRHSGASESPMEWGPLHPCYPHLNPHVPVTSPLYTATRIIRIPRDWMMAGDLSPAFANVYPEVLDGILAEQQFRELLHYINDELSSIFSPFSLRNWTDSFIGLITFWLWDDFGLTGIKRRLRALENWIEKWNRDVGSNEGVQLIPLRRTAYMSLDIQIPDPQISPDPVPRTHLHPDDVSLQPQSPYGAGNIRPRVAAAA